MNQSIMPAMASCKTMDVEKEEISNEQEDTQISEIDDLMEKKCETLIQKDNTNYENINNELNWIQMEVQSRILEQLQQQHFKPNILHIHIKTKNIK